MLILLVLALGVCGCGSWFKPIEWSELGGRRERAPKQFHVVPESNRDAADLSPDDIVNVMDRVGFSDRQIIDLGVDLQLALLEAGAARIAYGKEDAARFVVNGEYLYVDSRMQAPFMYDLSTGRFVPVGPPDLGRR